MGRVMLISALAIARAGRAVVCEALGLGGVSDRDTRVISMVAISAPVGPPWTAVTRLWEEGGNLVPDAVYTAQTESTRSRHPRCTRTFSESGISKV